MRYPILGYAFALTTTVILAAGQGWAQGGEPKKSAKNAAPATPGAKTPVQVPGAQAPGTKAAKIQEPSPRPTEKPEPKPELKPELKPVLNPVLNPELKPAEATAEQGGAKVAESQAGSRPEAPVAGETPTYGRVISKTVPVRCFASQRSPVYEDVLRQGDVVVVGDAAGEYRRVVLPLGVLGYVHRKFTSLPKDGVITTTRPKVSFRYRPKSGEAPVQLLEKGAEMRYLGEQGDWWKVRFVPEAAWVPVKDIQVFQKANETLVKSHEELRKLHTAQCADAATAYARTEAEAAERKKQAEQVVTLRRQFMEKRKLPHPEQLEELTKLGKEVEKAAAAMPEKSAPRQDLNMLSVSIQRQATAVEAQMVINEKPKPATDVVPIKPAVPESPVKKFVATGWLRFDKRASGRGRYRLEKGRKLIAYVTCSNARYNLKLLDGVEVGVQGKRSLGGEPVAPVIEVERVEVLSVNF